MTATDDQLEEWSKTLLSWYYDEHAVLRVGKEIFDSIDWEAK